MITEFKAYARLAGNELRPRRADAVGRGPIRRLHAEGLHPPRHRLPRVIRGVPPQSIIDSPFALIKGLAECAHDDEDMSHLFDNQPCSALRKGAVEMRRLFNSRQRFLLAMRAGGKCESCGVKLTKETYPQTTRPWSKGGETVTTNGAALCAKCNKQVQIMGMKETREWQTVAGAISSATAKAAQLRDQRGPRRRQDLRGGNDRAITDRGRHDRPRRRHRPPQEGRHTVGKPVPQSGKAEMMKITGKYFQAINPEQMQDDIAATWSGIKGMADALQIICESQRVLVIADEVHHAALGAVWGDGTTNALASAKHVLALTAPHAGRRTGTNLAGRRAQDAGDQLLKLPYSEAIDKKWCASHPAPPRRRGEHHDGQPDHRKPRNRHDHPPTIKMTTQMKNKLRFDRVIKQPLYEADGVTPQLPSYHSTMIDWADDKLEELRSREYGDFGLPNAGGLVIAPSIEMAEYFKTILEMKHPDDTVTLVHSKMGTAAEQVIDAFSRSDNKWIVSVNMISEGVDIPGSG